MCMRGASIHPSTLVKMELKPLPYYILSTEKFSDLGLLVFRKVRIGMPGIFSSSLFGGQFSAGLPGENVVLYW